MKLGACIGVNIKEDQLKQLINAGLEFAELSVSKVYNLTEEEFKALCDLFAKYKIKSEAMNVFFPADLKVTGPERDEGKIKNYLDIALPRVKKLGAQYIVFGSSDSRRVPEGFSRDEAWKQLITDCLLISDKIRPYGITIVIEPLNTTSCNILNSVAEGAKLVRDVNKDNILLLADYYHMMVDDESISHLVDYAPIIKHMHVSEKDRYLPRERAPIYDLFFKTIKQTGYSERLSLEGHTKDLVNDISVGLSVLKSYL